VASTLTLDAQPDIPVLAGATVTITTTGAGASDMVLLAVGETLGTTPISVGKFVTFDVGLATPFIFLPVGMGDVNLSFKLPTVPPALVGTTLNLQAVALGWTFGGGPPTVTASVSNLDALAF
jgi:hypothetical protein